MKWKMSMMTVMEIITMKRNRNLSQKVRRNLKMKKKKKLTKKSSKRKKKGKRKNLRSLVTLEKATSGPPM